MDRDSRQALLHGPASKFRNVSFHQRRRKKQDAEANRGAKSVDPSQAAQFLSHWKWEVIVMTMSTAALIGIAAILWAYGNQPMSAWHAFLRPNTVVSALSTVSKSAMLMVIGEGIGQLKWVYFEQRPHRLADFDTFDGGSRGPLGAIKMLYKINGRAIVASIGGIVTILALAMDPFVQQVVSFESKPRNNPEVPSLISTARSYDHSVLGAPSNFAMPTYPVILDSAVDAEITGAIYAAIFSRGLNGDTFKCSSGNCRWPTFETLGICSTCDDVTNQTTMTDHVPKNYSRDGGPHMRKYITPAKSEIWRWCGEGANAAIEFGTLWNSTLNQTLSAEGNEASGAREHGELGTLSSIKVSNRIADGLGGGVGNVYGDCEAALQQVLDCRITWCVKRYSATEVVNGSLSDAPQCAAEALTFMDQVIPAGNISVYNTSLPAYKWWTTLYPENWSSEPNCTFGCPLRLPAFKTSQLPDVSQLKGLYKYSDFKDNPDAFWVGWMDDYNMRTALRNTLTTVALSGSSNPNTNDSDARGRQFHESSDFPALLDKITESLTLAMRQGPNSTTVNGTTAFIEQYIVVHWPWMALPASLVLIAILFLATSMAFAVEKSGAVWKSSTIPILFHGLSGWDFTQLQDVQLSAMEQQAQGMRATLREDASGRLVLMEGPDGSERTT